MKPRWQDERPLTPGVDKPDDKELRAIAEHPTTRKLNAALMPARTAPRTAIAFFTKDRVDLTRRSMKPLLRSGQYDVFWLDGSDSEAGRKLVEEGLSKAKVPLASMRLNVKGGPDAAVAYALTLLLGEWHGGKQSMNYDYIGLVENDVLLNEDWFPQTMDLFETGRREGLTVGAVSARAYEDRVLFQRDGYAVMHNLGWGTQIMTRKAAYLALHNMRSTYTVENRRLFCQLAGVDLGTFWAFRTGDHWLVPDWGNDKILAAHGLASLALTPSSVEMIGQEPPLAAQNLTIVKSPVESRRDDAGFARYAANLKAIHEGQLSVPVSMRHRADDGAEIVFAHHLPTLPGFSRSDHWRHKWVAGFGPFPWTGAKGAELVIEASGPCRFMVMGDTEEAQIAVEDLKSGYIVRPTLLPTRGKGQVMQVIIPAGVLTRKVRLSVVKGDPTIFGVAFQQVQPSVPFAFDHSLLPGL